MSDDNKQLVDRGWEEMSALLDIEMPIKKDRDKFMWIWFGLFLGLAVLFLIAYQKVFHEPKELIDVVHTEVGSEPTNPTSGDKVIQEETEIQDDGVSTDNFRSENVSISNERSDLEGVISQSTNQESEIASNSKIPNLLTISSSNSNTDLVDSNNSSFSSTNTTNSKISSVAEDIISNKSMTLKNSEEELFQKSLIQLESLRIDAFRLYPLIEKEFSLYDMIIAESETSMKGYLFAGTNISRILDGRIQLVGGHLGYSQPLHEKWSLNYSLSYQTAFGLNTTTSLDQGALEEDMSVDTNTSFGGSNNASAQQMKRARALNFSLIPSYAINTRVSVGGGLIVGYHSNMISSNDVSAIRASEPIDYQFNYWNYGLTLGVNYALLRNLNIGVNYSNFQKDLFYQDPSFSSLNIQGFDPSLKSRNQLGISINYLFRQ